MQRRNGWIVVAVGLIAALCLADVSLAQEQPGKQKQRQKQGQTSRRSQRVKMEQIQVASPDGKVKLTIAPNAERLTFTVTLGDKTLIEPSALVMKVDDYDLSSGVVLGKVERYEINESYPWHGAHSTAVNHCNGVRIPLQHDLSFINYVLEVRVFNDGVAFRHVIPGDEGASRVPDEYTTFIIPAGATVWHQDLSGHYESAYNKDDISDLQAGQWSGPPVTFELPGGSGYGAITEANLVNYSGMGLEADGRRGLITGLGHLEPLNYPFELRHGREEGKRLAKPAAVVGTITTPWRVVLVGPDLNTLVNSDILPNLCPAPDKKYFPEGIDTPWVKPGRAVWRYLDGGDGSLLHSFRDRPDPRVTGRSAVHDWSLAPQHRSNWGRDGPSPQSHSLLEICPAIHFMSPLRALAGFCAGAFRFVEKSPG